MFAEPSKAGKSPKNTVEMSKCGLGGPSATGDLSGDLCHSGLEGHQQRKGKKKRFFSLFIPRFVYKHWSCCQGGFPPRRGAGGKERALERVKPTLHPSSMLGCYCGNVTNAKNNPGVAIETLRVATCEPGEDCTLLRTLFFGFFFSLFPSALLSPQAGPAQPFAGLSQFLFSVVPGDGMGWDEDGRSLFFLPLFIHFSLPSSSF